MTHDMYIQNNTGAVLTLNIMQFVRKADPPHQVRLEDGEDHTAQVECYAADAYQKIRIYCAANGIVLGSTGLVVMFTEPTPE